MINPKLSSVPAKNLPNFDARPHKIANCEKSTPFKTIKTFFIDLHHSYMTLYKVTKEKMQTKHFLFTLTGGL